MVERQRQMGEHGGVVLEGRDIGTVVFPQADIKFFLLASADERGARRYRELRGKGLQVNLAQTIAEVEARDAADSAREHAPLVQATDAVAIDSTRLGIDEVLAEMLRLVAAQRGKTKE
jgi:cytidylate kinase